MIGNSTETSSDGRESGLIWEIPDYMILLTYMSKPALIRSIQNRYKKQEHIRSEKICPPYADPPLAETTDLPAVLQRCRRVNTDI